MARRRSNEGGLEAAVSVLALLPWWVCVALAVITYLVFSSLAAAPAKADVARPAGMIVGAYVQGLSSVLQYLAPLLCAVAAVVSIFKRKRRASLVQHVGASSALSALNGISWQEFELLVGEAFRMQGFTVKEFGGAQPDGGVDLELRREGKTYLVQCKQWRTIKVGVAVVRELYGVMAARGAAGGYVITSGRFTTEAAAWAGAQKRIVLIDGPKLHSMIQRARAKASDALGRAPHPRPGPSGRMEQTPTPTPVPLRAPNHELPDAVRGLGANARLLARKAASPGLASNDEAALPICPRCASAMVRRTAKSGAHAGSQFWGCTQFPVCRGTR